MKASAVNFALLALCIGVTGCGVVDPQEPEEAFRLNAISTVDMDWLESFEGVVGCSANTVMHGGRMEFEDAKFTLSFWQTDRFPPPSEFRPDTTILTGTQRAYGPVLVLTTSDGDSLFAAMGPSPGHRTTIVLSDPSGALRGCQAYRFVVPGASPADRTSDGNLDLSFSVEEVYLARWARLPIMYTVNSIVGDIYIHRGKLKLRESGDYSATLEFTQYSRESDPRTATAGGRYVVGGAWIMLDPMNPRQAVMTVGEDGVTELRQRFRFTPGAVKLPGPVRMRVE